MVKRNTTTDLAEAMPSTTYCLRPIFRVSFLCIINLDIRVLLVSCVDLLITKFIISFSELRVDHRFLLLDEYLLF